MSRVKRMRKCTMAWIDEWEWEQVAIDSFKGITENIFRKKWRNIWRLQKKPLPLHSQIRNGSLAQLNRASDYGSEGCGFESRGSHRQGCGQGRFHFLFWPFFLCVFSYSLAMFNKNKALFNTSVSPFLLILQHVFYNPSINCLVIRLLMCF